MHNTHTKLTPHTTTANNAKRSARKNDLRLGAASHAPATAG